MNHLMIDIETLDTRPSAVILSVAVLMFDPTTREQQELYSGNLDAGMQLLEGRTISLDTVKWWMQQDFEARQKAFACPTTIEWRTVHAELAAILNRDNVKHIWANDPDFDCTILRDFMGYDFKWPFYKHRSMRTIKALFPEAYNPPGKEYGEFVAHDPMEDCKKQAWHVMNVYEHIEKMKSVGG